MGVWYDYFRAPDASTAAAVLERLAGPRDLDAPPMDVVLGKGFDPTIMLPKLQSLLTGVSYLGFIVGPVYVGLWADAVGLRGAMVAVAALAVGLFVLTPALLRLSGFGHSGRRSDVRDDEAARRTPASG